MILVGIVRICNDRWTAKRTWPNSNKICYKIVHILCIMVALWIYPWNLISLNISRNLLLLSGTIFRHLRDPRLNGYCLVEHWIHSLRPRWESPLDDTLFVDHWSFLFTHPPTSYYKNSSVVSAFIKSRTYYTRRDCRYRRFLSCLSWSLSSHYTDSIPYAVWLVAMLFVLASWTCCLILNWTWRFWLLL